MDIKIEEFKIHSVGVEQKILDDILRNYILDNSFKVKTQEKFSNDSILYNEFETIDATITIVTSVAFGVLVREVSNIVQKLLSKGSERVIIKLENYTIDVPRDLVKNKEDIIKLLDDELSKQQKIKLEVEALLKKLEK